MRLGPLVGAAADGVRWVRLFGYGVSVTDHRQWPPLFSERQGIRTYRHLGPYCVRFLRPGPAVDG